MHNLGIGFVNEVKKLKEEIEYLNELVKRYKISFVFLSIANTILFWFCFFLLVIK